MISARNRTRLGVLGLALTAVLALQVVSLTELGGSLRLPSSGELVTELDRLMSEGELWPNVLATVQAVVASLLLAIVLGVAGGYCLWRWQVLDRAISPYLTVYYAIPAFAFYPALILFLGVNLAPIIVLATLWTLGAVVIGVHAGLKTTSHHYDRVIQVYGLTEWQAFWRVRMRAAAPSTLAGIRLGASYALIAVIASEFILAGRGLGHLAASAYDSFQSVTVYAAMAVVVVLTVVTLLAVGAVGRMMLGVSE